MALLHLANVLHRSHHSQDALVALRIALTSSSPSTSSSSSSTSSVYLTMGNVLAVSSLTHGSSHSLTHSLNHSPTHSTHSPTHSLIQSHTHPPTHSLTHSPTPLFLLHSIFLQHLKMINESANAYSQAVQLSPKSSSAKTLLQAANCELQLHAATHDHSQKMATTRRKLDLFYEHITDLYYHQKSTSPDVLNYWNEAHSGR